MKYKIRERQVRTSNGEVTRRTFQAYKREGPFWWKVRDGSGVTPMWGSLADAYEMINRYHRSITSYTMIVDHEVKVRDGS